MAEIKLISLDKLNNEKECDKKFNNNDSVDRIHEIESSSDEDNDKNIKLDGANEKQIQITLKKLPNIQSIIEEYNLDEIRDTKNKIIASTMSSGSGDPNNFSGNSNINAQPKDTDDDSNEEADLNQKQAFSVKKFRISESDEDNLSNTRKRKRSKGSVESNVFDDDCEDKELLSEMKKAKKRKRIVQCNDTSDEDSHNEDESRVDGKRRKNIRQFKGNESLEETTKTAAREEKLRLERLMERQKIYNSICDSNEEKSIESKCHRLVLDFDEDTKEVLLEVDQGIVSHLKPHQSNGIKFMWEACFESLNQLQKSKGSGCILAHCMGLGKTLQVVSLVHTLLENASITGVKHVLIVSPLSTVLNWVNEFDMWCSKANTNFELNLYELSKSKQNIDRAYRLKEWYEDGGVLIIGYEMFRNLTNIGTKIRKKLREDITKALLEPGPELVICDEGHLLKNEKTSLAKAMNKISTSRRIVLTGTPLQNNLREYYVMIQFVKPNLLGTYKEYLNRFVNPITNGQYCDSTELDIRIMRRRSHVLHNMLEGCIQRRDYAVLSPFLPKKHEYVVFIKLTDLQTRLYKFYMEHRPASDTSKKATTLFQDFQNLQRIWTHPRVLRYNSDNYEKIMAKKDLDASDSEGSLRDFVVDSDNESDAESSTMSDTDEEGNAQNTRVIRTRNKAAELEEDGPTELEDIKRENPTEWWMQMVSNDDLDKIEHSSKLMVLFSILQMCEEIGDKLLIFSQSLYSLNVIEHFLRQVDDKTQNTNPNNLKYSGSWSLGLDYFRLDGSTPVESRSQFCTLFNDETNSRARLFLISTRAGGLGINLVAANRVIIFDVSWNPSHDIQSIFRIYRFGQKKPCYVYRFVALGTMEEKIYERQVTKEAISKRVIDEQQIDRHYKEKDILELYMTDLEQEKSKEIPLLPKDRLFADILSDHSNWIYKYHEHDSLLENKEAEILDEDERKAAWDDFNLEKERKLQISNLTSYSGLGQKGYNGGPAASSQIFGIQSNVLLMLLQVKIKRDFPFYSQAQINQAVPLLMQELYRQMANGEITLYQELLDLRSTMITAVQEAGPSSTYHTNTYASPSQITQYQQNWIPRNRFIDPNEVVEID